MVSSSRVDHPPTSAVPVAVHADVDFGVGNSLSQLLDDALQPISIKISRLDDFEAASQIISQVSFGSDKGRANASMNRRVANQALFMSYVEECTMIDPR
jgi:hypothetical protein